MSVTGLEVFDTTLQKTHVWLNDILAELGADDRHLAYGALRAALHALRDRLTVPAAVHLGAQLPMLIRGLYYDGWDPNGKPVKAHRAEFLDVIREHFRASPQRPDPERIARAVFKVVARHVSAGEVQNVRDILPKELRDLWPGN
jgi:uncharacterized protein (DUF2267 family)